MELEDIHPHPTLHQRNTPDWRPVPHTHRCFKPPASRSSPPRPPFPSKKQEDNQFPNAPFTLDLLQFIRLQDATWAWRHLAPPKQTPDVAFTRAQADGAHEVARTLTLGAHHPLVLLVGIIVGNRTPKARPRAQLARHLAAAAAILAAPPWRGGDRRRVSRRCRRLGSRRAGRSSGSGSSESGGRSRRRRPSQQRPPGEGRRRRRQRR